jgi:glycosyltransferase involved in cell wall biosynthesis
VRIALLSERGATTPPSTHGGTERAVDMLARGLRDSGQEVTVWAQPGSKTDSYEVRHFEPQPGFLSAADIVSLADHDVIHVHGMGSNWTGFRTVERLLAIKRRLVQTYHGTFPYYIRPYSLWLRSVPRKARPHFITQTHQQVAYARRHGIPNVLRIPNPAPDMPFGARPQDYFLYMGRVIPGKGVRTAIQVARRARVRLLIAGASDPAFARDEILPRVGGDVEFLGEVDDATKARLLREAKALLFPSRFPEGMPLTVLEANACGTPVISSTGYGAAPDLIEPGVNGFLCRSIDEMVQATGQVDGVDRRACRASIRRRFSAATITRQHLELYQQVFGPHDGHAPSSAWLGAPLGAQP